ncbi:hypothetical protein AKH17_03925, partial [Pelagibacteraceae bacterium GOM-A2]
SVAKKDLKAGQKLDGEGGYCARGRLISSKISKQERILPMGYQLLFLELLLIFQGWPWSL